MTWVLFSWVKIDRLDKKSLKSSMWTEISLVGNNERHMEQQFGKKIGIGTETLKIIVLAYEGTIFKQ